MAVRPGEEFLLRSEEQFCEVYSTVQGYCVVLTLDMEFPLDKRCEVSRCERQRLYCEKNMNDETDSALEDQINGEKG